MLTPLDNKRYAPTNNSPNAAIPAALQLLPNAVSSIQNAIFKLTRPLSND